MQVWDDSVTDRLLNTDDTLSESDMRLGSFGYHPFWVYSVYLRFFYQEVCIYS